MQVKELSISGVFLITPEVFYDERGSFFESFNHANFEKAVNRKVAFFQDNHSISKKGVIRGLHFQLKHQQGKLIRVVKGKIFDVAIDIRKDSPTYGCWLGEIISAKNKKQLWIPEGFAHGFQVLSSSAELVYKTTDYYFAQFERTILWNDKDLNILWPIKTQPILSNKDQSGVNFCEI